jgi:hypothetical protein
MPMATTVPTAVPDMAAKIALARIVARPSPPQTCPTTLRVNMTRSRVSPPSLIRLPDRMNSGIASNG